MELPQPIHPKDSSQQKKIRQPIPQPRGKEPKTWKEVVQALEVELYTPSNKYGPKRV